MCRARPPAFCERLPPDPDTNWDACQVAGCAPHPESTGGHSPREFGHGWRSHEARSRASSSNPTPPSSPSGMRVPGDSGSSMDWSLRNSSSTKSGTRTVSAAVGMRNARDPSEEDRERIRSMAVRHGSTRGSTSEAMLMSVLAPSSPASSAVESCAPSWYALVVAAKAAAAERCNRRQRRPTWKSTTMVRTTRTRLRTRICRLPMARVPQRCTPGRAGPALGSEQTSRRLQKATHGASAGSRMARVSRT
mmetsp:Transcript_2413/g.6022  ORF Transcript_2413/g.6022 Transcript_2413/m.6022 type:complete len:249 (+) Transcript_2413:292-1038(+)